jgi:hypothetical protein
MADIIPKTPPTVAFYCGNQVPALFRNIAMQSGRLKNKVYLNFTVVIPFSHRVDEYS